MTLRHEDITRQIIRAFYTVYNALGHGFLEKAYEKALAIELRKMGLDVVQQAPITIYYAGQVIGEYYADLLVAGTVIVEIKAAQKLIKQHEAQLLNYLKATPYEVGLLLNFGPKPDFKRRIYDNEKKGLPTWLR